MHASMGQDVKIIIYLHLMLENGENIMKCENKQAWIGCTRTGGKFAGVLTVITNVDCVFIIIIIQGFFKEQPKGSEGALNVDCIKEADRTSRFYK